MFPEWSWLMGLLIGATIGSFLNMLIYRLPRRLSFVNPPKSFCPKCKHPLGVIDLFPLFSWLSTGGKCRYCKEPVAVRYFLVEVLTGGLFAGIWWQYFIAGYDPLKAIFYALTAAALVAIIFIDWELYIIPDEINAFILGLGIVYHWIDNSLQVALVGGLLGWGLLWGIAFLGRIMFRKDAMGHGDIKMMRGVGAVIGPALLVASLGMAVVAGLVIGVTLIIVVSRRRTEVAEDEVGEDYPPESIGSLLKLGVWYLLCLDIVGIFFPNIYRLIGEEPSEENIEEDDWSPSLTTIPFGPYLAIGALVCMLFGTRIEQGMADYWRDATGGAMSEQQVPGDPL